MAGWRDLAACRGCDPALFVSDTKALETIEVAKAVCDTCPVIEPCLEWAIVHVEVGVLGGTSDQDRALIRKARRRAAATASLGRAS